MLEDVKTFKIRNPVLNFSVTTFAYKKFNREERSELMSQENNQILVILKKEANANKKS